MADDSGAIKLEKKVGLLSGCGIIIGNIIGSGIFISPKGVLMSSGSLGMSILLWVICGVFSSVGSLCYAELGTTIKESGGDYVYIHQAFGGLVAFIQMWVTMLVVRPAAQAIIAMTFAQYLILPVMGECENPIEAQTFLAIVCLMFITFINCVSVKASTIINNVFMIAKILSLLLIIFTGAYYMVFEGRTQNFENAFDNTIYNPLSFSMAFYNGMFAYAGWNYLNFMTDEIQNPNRNLPLAIAISLPLVTVIYVLANISYFSALSPQELLDAPAVGIAFAETYLGPISWIIPLLVAMSTFSAVNGSILTGSRLTFVGAKYKQLPQILAMINLDYLTPVPSVLLTGFVSILMVLPGNIGDVMTYFSFVFYLTIDMAVFAQIYLRFKYPNWERPIKLPIVIPILFVVICSLILICSFIADPFPVGIGFAMTLTAIPVYVIFIMFQDKLHLVKIPQMTEAFTHFWQRVFKLCLEESEPVAKSGKAIEAELIAQTEA